MGKGKKKNFKNKVKSQVTRPSWLNIYAGAKNSDETVVEIYGDIGESWWEESISARDFSRLLKDIKTGTILLKVNSLGGSVFDGTAIHNQLKSHKAKVIAVIDGIAASIASVIVMAADEIRMPANAMLMIHDPWTCSCGTSDEMRKAADALDKIKESIIASYARSGLSQDEISQLMAEETWFTAQDAVDQGFADTIIDDKQDVSNYQRSSFSNYYNKMPQGVIMAKNKGGDKKAPVKGKQKNHKNKSSKSPENKNLKDFRDEVARQAEVKSICAQYGITGSEVQAFLDDKSMTGDILKAEAMAASPHATHLTPPDNMDSGWIVGDSDTTKFNNAMSHGIMINAGIKPKKADGELAPLADGYEDFVNLTSVELCRAYLGRQGVSMSGMSRGQIANAALGISEFVETLEQTANTILVTGYADKPAKHRAITAYRPANDYNQLRELRVESEWQLEKILEDGKISHGKVYEGTEGYAVNDFGKKFVITRKVIVNDRLGAVMASLDRAGRRVTLMEDRDIFTYINGTPKLSDGTNLFSVANKTLATAGALAKDTLSAGRALLAQQPDMTGHAVGADDYVLLTSTDDRTDAEELIGAISQPNDTRRTLWQYLTPVHSPLITGAFFQFADPREFPVIGFSNLQGEEAPYIETKTSFGVRNVEMAIVYTYGYGVIGKVGVVKTPAA